MRQIPKHRTLTERLRWLAKQKVLPLSQIIRVMALLSERLSGMDEAYARRIPFEKAATES
jgi:hypothetical protein